MHRNLTFNTDYIGLSESAWAAIASKTQDAAQAIAAMDELGQLGFMHLDFLQDQVATYRQVLAKIPFQVKTHLVIGIGGSSLGGRTILSALGAPSGVRTLFLESTDPDCVAKVTADLDWAHTLVSVISKSGNTLETMAVFFTVAEKMKAALAHAPSHYPLPRGEGIKGEGDSLWTSHVLVITDPKSGFLRKLAVQEKFLSLEVPEAIGGRFSVLTAVGMVPALIAGLDVDDFFHGAREIKRRAGATGGVDANPALHLAAIQYVLHKTTHLPMTVVMPYAESLRDFTEWVAQLLAESIGKKVNTAQEVVHEGFSALKAVGSVDQHSQCQLYLEGPRDKWAIFLEVDEWRHEITVPMPFEKATGWEWLAGKTLHGILNAQLAATAQALHEQGMPNLTISIPSLSPYALGQLFFLFEWMTAYLGVLYDVNAFDQPGVERIKVLTFERLK